MQITGFVPSKLNSQRLPRKNVLELGGTPLINHVLATLSGVPTVDETVVYASDDEVMAFVDANLSGIRFVQRPVDLDSDTATVQDFVGGFLSDVDCDIVVLLHATSPFISKTTVGRCIEAVVSGQHDSAFAALELRRFAWFRGAPLNYALDRPIPRTQDLEPVVVEQSGFYVFTRALFETTGRRVGDDPYIAIVDEVEGHDIDTPLEFQLAERLLELRERR